MTGGRISETVARVVLSGVRAVAPELIGQLELERLCADDSVPLGPYRAVLERIYRADGGVALLRAGVAASQARDPVLFVLLNSDSPVMLFEKEARLARFVHSRHMLRPRDVGPTGLTVDHVSSVAGEPPEPAESLAACGQHIELLRQIGCDGLELRFPASADPDRRIVDDAGTRAPAPGGGYHRWAFRWRRFAPTRRPMPGLDEVLLASRRTAELEEIATVAAAAEAVFRRDLARTWTVVDVARDLGMSSRSLQRALRGEGTTFSRELDRTRLTEARRLLDDTALSITEIGYVCGFTDGAHFSRRFRARFGQTPTGFRARRSPG